MKGKKGFQKGHKNYISPEKLKDLGTRLGSLPRTSEWKEKIGKAHRGRKYPERSGDHNPAWKGGITTEQQKARNSTEYFIWRNEVYRKDNWTCRICKTKCRKGNIVAHHLQLFSEFPELRYSVDNGVVLCRSCHAALHKGSKSLPEYGY